MEGLIGFVVGFVLGGFIIGVAAINNGDVRAVKAGVAEYYINTNNYSKEFRWKVCK